MPMKKPRVGKWQFERHGTRRPLKGAPRFPSWHFISRGKEGGMSAQIIAIPLKDGEYVFGHSDHMREHFVKSFLDEQRAIINERLQNLGLPEVTTAKLEPLKTAAKSASLVRDDIPKPRFFPPTKKRFGRWIYKRADSEPHPEAESGRALRWRFSDPAEELASAKIVIIHRGDGVYTVEHSDHMHPGAVNSFLESQMDHINHRLEKNDLPKLRSYGTKKLNPI